MNPETALDLIRAAELVGYERGRVDACIWNAELHSDEVAERHWRETITQLNVDRRDTKLHDRIRQHLRSDPKKVGFYDRFVLYLADHPEVSYQHDPELQPHGRARVWLWATSPGRWS